MPATFDLLTGATGFVGGALVRDLRRDGRDLIVFSRDVARARRRLPPEVRVVQSLDEIEPDTRLHAVVNLAGARVVGLPWTAARRRVLLESRTGVTGAVVALLQRLRQPPAVLVSASAVGYYGASPEAAPFEPRDEDSPPRPGQFQSDLCVAAEAAARRAEGLGVRVVRLRFGVVLGRGDGVYPLLALPARLGLGAILGSGRQAAPWIHLDDVVGLIRFAIARESLHGPVNATALDTPTQEAFARALAGSFGRTVWLRLPATPLRLAMGESADLLLAGQNVIPRVALASGFVFRHPTLKEALAALK